MIPLLEDVVLETQQTMWFIHDVAPAHFTCNVKKFVNSHYPVGRMKQTGFVASSSVMSTDFYLWDHLKGIAYSKIVNTWCELWCLI